MIDGLHSPLFRQFNPVFYLGFQIGFKNRIQLSSRILQSRFRRLYRGSNVLVFRCLFPVVAHRYTCATHCSNPTHAPMIGSKVPERIEGANEFDLGF